MDCRGGGHGVRELRRELRPNCATHHAGPERLLPHRNPRFVEAIEPPLVLGIVGAADVVGARLEEEREIGIELRIGGRRPRVGPLRVVVPAVELDHVAVEREAAGRVFVPPPQREPFHDGAAADRDVERVQLRVGHALPHARRRHLDAAELHDPVVRLALEPRRRVIIEAEVEAVAAVELGVVEDERDVHRVERRVGRQRVRAPHPRQRHRGLRPQLVERHRAHEAAVVPKVAAGVQRRGGGVEAVVGEHEELAVGVARRRRRHVDVERDVAARAVLAHLHAVDEDAAVEGARAEPQPRRRVGGLREGRAVEGDAARPGVPGRHRVDARRHRRLVRRQICEL